MLYKNIDEDKIVSALIQGEAYNEALRIMCEEVDAGEAVHKDEFIIHLLAEEAEGMYSPKNDNSPEWKVPEKKFNKHIEIAVQDKDDYRMIPDLKIRCAIRDKDGNGLEEYEMPFLWHPFLFHYGSNVELPGEGEYTFSITIQQPQFGRHDEVNGKKYPRAVQVDIGPLHLKPGRKPHGPE